MNSNDFTDDHIRRILTNAAKNNQLLGSVQIGPLIGSLRSRKKLPEAEFEKLLKEHGLAEHALDLP